MRATGPVLGVIGGSGGVGASTFAAVLALAAAPSVLVDLDCAGGGLDVLLGVEHEPGARWSQLHVAGGRLDPDELVAGVPQARGCAVLAADVAAVPPDAVEQVVAAAAGHGPVVLDLPRHGDPARAVAVSVCELVVVVVRSDVAGLVAAHAVVDGLTDPGDVPRGVQGGVPVAVVARPGPVAAAEAARLVGGRLVGTMPTGRRAPSPWRPPRALRTVADGVLAALRDAA